VNSSAGCIALQVLCQAHGARRRIGPQQAGHLEVVGELASLDQQLERAEAAATGHDIVVLAIDGQHHVEVLQQAHAGDARGQFGDRRAAALAHVAAGRPQLGQRNQPQFLRSRDGCDSSSDGGGFMKGSGVHIWKLLSHAGTLKVKKEEKRGRGFKVSVSACAASCGFQNRPDSKIRSLVLASVVRRSDLGRSPLPPSFLSSSPAKQPGR